MLSIPIGLIIFLIGASAIFGAAGAFAANREEQVVQTEVTRRKKEELDTTIAQSEIAGTQAAEKYAADVLRAAGAEEFAVGEAEKARGFAVGEAEKARDLLKQQSREDYQALLAGNLDEQGINRMMKNRAYMDAGAQAALEQGAGTARMAQSGVRRTGSAAGLLSETTRLYDVDLALIDEQLAIEEQRFGRERTGLKREWTQAGARADFGYEGATSLADFQFGQTTRAAAFQEKRAVSGAALTYEHTAEGILGRDITREELFGGDLGFADTLLTGRLAGELGWEESELEGLQQDLGLDVLLGAATGGLSTALKLV